MNLSQVYKFKNDNWATPNYIYELFKEKGFGDPCPLDPNGCMAFFNQWPEKSFVNPPYSNIKPFVDYAILQKSEFWPDLLYDIWFLLPVRCCSEWFKTLYEYGCNFVFIKGRLCFGGATTPAPFDCMLVHLIGTGESYFGWVDRNCISKFLEVVLL